MTLYPPTSDRDEWRHLYEERAAILEYCGGMPRAEAEAEAREALTKAYRLQRETEA